MHEKSPTSGAACWIAPGAVRINDGAAHLKRSKRQVGSSEPKDLGAITCRSCQHACRTIHFWRASTVLACHNTFHETGLHVRPLLLQVGAPVVIRANASASPLSIGQTLMLASGAAISPNGEAAPAYVFFFCPTREPGAGVREAVPVGDGLLGRHGMAFLGEVRAFCIRRSPRVPHKGPT
jgi:hypothetical protein